MSQSFPASPIPAEILAHLLASLSCLSRAPLPYPPTIIAPSPQSATGSLSFSPSSLAPQIGTGEILLANLHTRLSIRISHFLFLIWASGGWGSIALSSLISHSLPRSFSLPLEDDSWRDPLAIKRRAKATKRLSQQSQLQRHYVIEHALDALGSYHRVLPKYAQLALHVEVVWLTRFLDLRRKEAHLVRDVVKRISSMIAERRDENRRGIMPEKSDESNEASEAIGLGLGIAVPQQAIAVRRRESTDGNASILSLIERTCDVMGIDLISLGQTKAALPADDGYPDKMRFGWPEIQVTTIQSFIAVAESLPDTIGVVRLCLTALKVLCPFLNSVSPSSVTSCGS